MVDEDKVKKLLEFRAYKFELENYSALELKQLLNSIPDERLIDVMICDKDGYKLDDVMFSVVGKDYQKVIVF